MAHAQKPDFVFRRNGRVHLNQRGRQFSRLLAGEVCASAVVMLGTPCSEVVWRLLATHSVRHFPLPFPSRTSPCAIMFQLDSTPFPFTPSSSKCSLSCSLSCKKCAYIYLCFRACYMPFQTNFLDFLILIIFSHKYTSRNFFQSSVTYYVQELPTLGLRWPSG